MTNSIDNQPSDQKSKITRRSFIERTTKVAGLSLGLTFLDPINSLEVLADGGKVSSRRKPTLVFPVISDIHMNEKSDQTFNKFQTTLKQLNQLAPKQDAFAIVGDLTDNGLLPEYEKYKSTYETHKQAKAVSLIAIGNHDYWNGLSEADAQKRFLDVTKMPSIYFHQVIKGYHFIVLGTEDGVTEGTFSVSQIEWLSDQLKQAQADDPKKPIFVFHHQPIKDTMYGSEWGFNVNRDLFYDTLKKYPQVITFSGHTHYPLDDPRIIYQEDFTTIGTSTGAYLWLDAGRIQGEVPEGADILNQALIVEVYENKVLINRRDIHNNDWTGEPFEINLPANKNTFKYTDARKDKKPPFFTKDAMLSIANDMTTATSLAIMFTQAKDNLLVHDYKVIVTNTETKQVAKEYLGFSEFYKDPVPNPLILNLEGLAPSTTYDIEVFALDAYRNISTNSIKAIGRTKKGEPIKITLSKEKVNGIEDTLDVVVEGVRAPKSDWVGLYEVNENPGEVESIWWQYTEVSGGTCKFMYNPKNNVNATRYKQGSTYKIVYFYGSGYDAVASATFKVE
ncbi:metallophosphoesterase [Fictibacillus sp. b24]|uniref:metallophosphoesterase family protein n=1 Tax=Fictibacillus sp. b24 TaxID=3055863 RepID=UPI0025A11B59|nr:metallophosphoesterase [Fictibacillus sp. b24]MDM5317460.1 metallophosphoesterase [Fictibacillus sp. b24]